MPAVAKLQFGYLKICTRLFNHILIVQYFVDLYKACDMVPTDIFWFAMAQKGYNTNTLTQLIICIEKWKPRETKEDLDEWS